MRVIAVVVTYNRLSLLQECIGALKNQSYSPSSILVVNNNSTDGTTQWLAKQTGLETLNLPENKGGSWGFYEGMVRAYHSGADWIWVLDDDTICNPDTLQELITARDILLQHNEPVGFVSSKVLWKDGQNHTMNTLCTYPWHTPQQQLAYLPNDISRVQESTFVSCLFSKDAMKKAGLPIKEFFIWHDDIEYTRRMVRMGLIAGLATRSIVTHKTHLNYTSDIFMALPEEAWRYIHGLRNELYTRRYHKSYASFLRHVFKRMAFLPFKILARRKDHRWLFIKIVWKSSISALSFSPSITYLD